MSVGGVNFGAFRKIYFDLLDQGFSHEEIGEALTSSENERLVADLKAQMAWRSAVGDRILQEAENTEDIHNPSIQAEEDRLKTVEALEKERETMEQAVRNAREQQARIAACKVQAIAVLQALQQGLLGTPEDSAPWMPKGMKNAHIEQVGANLCTWVKHAHR